MLVELHSLSKAELNGRYGECTEWVQTNKRWAVQLIGGETAQSIAVKAANMRRAPPAPMKASNLAFEAANKGIDILSNLRADASGRYSQADVERVHALFDEAAKHDWANICVQQGRGDLAMMRSDLRGALVHFRRAVANGYNLKVSDGSGGRPGEQQLRRRVALAGALGNSGDLEGESYQLRQVLAVSPGHVHARLSLGQNLKQRGSVDDAVPELLMALQLPNEGPGHVTDEAALLQIRRTALEQLTYVYGSRASQLSQQGQHRASVDALQKLAKMLRDTLSGPQYYTKGEPRLARDADAAETEYDETTSAVCFVVGGRQISNTELLCRLVRDLARTESNMVSDYLLLHERANAKEAVARAELALALHPTTQKDANLMGRVVYERGIIKEDEGDEVDREGGEGATERAAVLYIEAKELYRASNKLCPDGAVKHSFQRVQVKAHPDMEFVTTLDGSHGPGGGMARLKPGRAPVQLEQL